MTPFIASSFKIFLFLAGLAVGSFLNVVALRYKGDGKLFDLRRLSGRSFCPTCKKKLRWYELVPLLSFITQLGWCRSCGQKISWQYPIVELVAGFTFLLPFYFDDYRVGTVWLLAALAMLLLSAIDWRLQIIPDQINIFLVSLGVANIVILSASEESSSFFKHYAEILFPIENIWLNHISAALIALLFMGFIIAASKGKAMGVGDLKLAGALGLLVGWPDIISVLALSFIVGSVWGLGLILLQGKNLKTSVAFGPFLVIGTFLHIFFGYQLLNFYFSLFL